MVCSKCNGEGFYLDPQCVKEDCWHGDRIATHTQPLPTEQLLRGVEPKKTMTKIPRIMPCPERPCPCRLGNPGRLALKEKAAQ